MPNHIKLNNFVISNDQPFCLIAGPCAMESEFITMSCAERLKEMTEALGIPFIFKVSIDKANRTSATSFRGLGLEQGLKILRKVKQELACPVLTDVHEVCMVEPVASVADVLQIPAFLCRQTDLLQAAAQTRLPINIKKGQFMAPQDMRHVVEKVKHQGNQQVSLCERGAMFGYQNLVVDMRGLAIMKQTGCPVIFDATHAVQLPGAGDGRSTGQREYVPLLAKAAISTQIAGVFIETHPNPENALSDGPNMIPLDNMAGLLRQLSAFDQLAKMPATAYSEKVVSE